MFGTILRWFSILFTVLGSALFAGLGLIATISHAKNFRLDQFPYWKGETLNFGVLILGLVGIASALVALSRRTHALLALFTLVVFLMCIYGYFVSPVLRFSGAEDAKWALAFSLGWLGAFCGSLYGLRLDSPSRR